MGDISKEIVVIRQKIKKMDDAMEEMERIVKTIPIASMERRMAEAKIEVSKSYRESLQRQYDQMMQIRKAMGYEGDEKDV